MITCWSGQAGILISSHLMKILSHFISSHKDLIPSQFQFHAKPGLGASVPGWSHSILVPRQDGMRLRWDILVLAVSLLVMTQIFLSITILSSNYYYLYIDSSVLKYQTLTSSSSILFLTFFFSSLLLLLHKSSNLYTKSLISQSILNILIADWIIEFTLMRRM